MKNNREYEPPKVNFKANFKKMCKEINYLPKKEEDKINGKQRIIYQGKGKGTL